MTAIKTDTQIAAEAATMSDEERLAVAKELMRQAHIYIPTPEIKVPVPEVNVIKPPAVI